MIKLFLGAAASLFLATPVFAANECIGSIYYSFGFTAGQPFSQEVANILGNRIMTVRLANENPHAAVKVVFTRANGEVIKYTLVPFVSQAVEAARAVVEIEYPSDGAPAAPNPPHVIFCFALGG